MEESLSALESGLSEGNVDIVLILSYDGGCCTSLRGEGPLPQALSFQRSFSDLPLTMKRRVHRATGCNHLQSTVVGRILRCHLRFPPPVSSPLPVVGPNNIMDVTPVIRLCYMAKAFGRDHYSS